MGARAAAQEGTGKRRRFAAQVSLVAGILIFGGKLAGFQLTGSTAVLSDALEAVVNVVAAVFALFAIKFAAQPADRDHPYGHGKMELLSAAFEGGLVAFAAVLTAWAALHALLGKAELKELDVGMAVTGAAAVANLLLGSYLLRVGKREGSPTLIADGHHVLSDVWTSGGAIVALVAVRFTGIWWLDPVAALLLAVLLARTGVRLVQEAAHGLLDREDPVLLQKLVDAFNATRVPGVGGLHRLRAIRSGEHVHVDAHVYVPSGWSVNQAHEVVVRLEREVAERCDFAVEIAFHLDPADSHDEQPTSLTVEEAVLDRPRP